MLSGSKLDTVVFFVSSLARSAAFYRDTLGLEVQAVEGHDGPFATAQAGAVALVFIERPSRVGESPVVVFNIGQGIDDCADALACRGVEIVVPVSEAPDGGLTLDFLDPDGAVLSLYQPPRAPRRR
ncbi:glyoxalase [Pseudoxanthomonas broegbernensis]|uniref:Glyoxalase n=1 Tax=Pseudoxanthomonas broegbernensis TaxID=83619 RepID=A0A7V8GMK4_9GAMM|nr:VOC family protein [Pseudoxanthomonas broegbernensis]KAF1686535.1 glyoxalase [Pseudoxanthomonas broegbernensis]MBB6064203.1 catechol 2,3-dioxygenase-like lactoylglutathione lyase family enzyme [Pseudoxanthomonas broegbernensis]